ncbi:hypothetical protein BJX99DRAFT_263369 [Aspergillus californicus]
MAPPQALLYVTSRVRAPPRISSEDFNAWYDNEHVPDILKTSGVNAAYRYNACAARSGPYLAVYPVRDMQFFGSQEYLTIPTSSDTLPGPTHLCFDIADFDSRAYATLAEIEDPDMPPGPSSELLAVEFDPPTHAGDAVMEWLTGTYTRRASQRVRAYKLDTVMYQAEKMDNLPHYLGLLEFDGGSDVYQAAIEEIQPVAKVARWELRKSFRN